LRIERNSLTEEEEKAYLEEERSAVVRRTAVRKKVRNKRNVSLFALSFLLLPLTFLFFFSTKKIFYWPSPGMLDRESAPGSTQKTKLNHTRCKLK
jgi:hypothetical protein